MGERIAEMDSLKTIAILGTGSMGIDLGLLAALHGFNVVLWHRKDSQVALNRLTVRIEKYVAKEILTGSDRELTLNRIAASNQLENLSNVDLVIETIAEDLTEKSLLLDRVGQIVSETCIVVSNTSSLSIEELAGHTRDPGRFAGLHFFNPALKMELVEIIAGSETTDETIRVLSKFCGMVGKISVRVKDSPGFIVNRLMAGQINQAIRMLEQDIASAEDIDKAVKLGLLHPMGPLALADLIGLDVLRGILNTLFEQTGDSNFESPACLNSKVESGLLGRKTGRGFYTYES
jgi:3-hydroxybutyryl-CoA dehydrogenase